MGLSTSRTNKHAALVLSKYKLRVWPVYADVPQNDQDCKAPVATTEDAAHQASIDAMVAAAARAGKAGQGGEAEAAPGGRKASSEAWAGAEAEASSEAAGLEAERWVRLVPLVQWYDSTHVASTDYYRRFVFDRVAKRVAKVRADFRFHRCLPPLFGASCHRRRFQLLHVTTA